MKLGRTTRGAHARVVACSVRAVPPLRNVTRAVVAPIGSDTVTVRRPARTTTVLTLRPLTENTIRRIGEPVTVTRARRTLQPAVRRRAVPRAARVPSTACAGAAAGAATRTAARPVTRIVPSGPVATAG